MRHLTSPEMLLALEQAHQLRLLRTLDPGGIVTILPLDLEVLRGFVTPHPAA